MNRNPGESSHPSLLAEKIGVTRATMTGLLDGLVKDGLIRRNPDRNDRRKLYLKLTDKGRGVLEAILPDYWTRISKLMGALTRTERKTFIRLLEKVKSGIPELTH
jgi:DNA-binding MarR family transcriptional regulator